VVLETAERNSIVGLTDGTKEVFISSLPKLMASCLDYSLSYIHVYPKTEQELRTKLYTKKYDERDILFTMDFLKKK
jgi:SOS response regulatory protein OraA/RecX